MTLNTPERSYAAPVSGMAAPPQQPIQAAIKELDEALQGLGSEIIELESRLSRTVLIPDEEKQPMPSQPTMPKSVLLISLEAQINFVQDTRSAVRKILSRLEI